MTMTEVTTAKGRYYVPTALLDAAIQTFDDMYSVVKAAGLEMGRRPNMVSLATAIAEDLMPDISDDPFGRRRLVKCILSLKGRKGGKKSQASIPKRDKQLTLFGG